MKTKHNNSLGASALQITFISISAVLLTLGAAPAKNQFEQKPPGANLAPPNAQRHPAVSESSGAAKRADARKSASIEFWASRQSVGGREIAGFSARQAGTAQEEKLTPPAGLKPVEQEAWLAMARRQGASGGNELTSFYPERYGEAFVVEGEGIRVAVRPVGGTDVTVQIDNGQVIYRQAYAETDSVHVASAGRSEEFLFLQNECAPREFAYELSEVSAGTRVELVKGEVHFTNRARGEDRSAVVDRSHWGAARGSGALGARGEQNWSGATVAAGGGGRAELSSADRSKLGDHRQHGHRT